MGRSIRTYPERILRDEEKSSRLLIAHNALASAREQIDRAQARLADPTLREFQRRSAERDLASGLAAVVSRQADVTRLEELYGRTYAEFQAQFAARRELTNQND